MSQSSQQGPTEVKPGTVSDDISNLCVTKENADVTFSVEGKIITTHKSVLTSRSDYFAKMFNTEWKEIGEVSTIEIKDTTYDIFEALLFYIYKEKISFPEEDYENIFGLMKLVDFHGAIKIKHECEKILVQNIDTENAIFLARNASLAKASDLETNALNFILDKRLLDVDLTQQELNELLGNEALITMAVVLFRRMQFKRL